MKPRMVPTGIICEKCKEEIMQRMSGNLQCRCGIHSRYYHFIAVGKG